MCGLPVVPDLEFPTGCLLPAVAMSTLILCGANCCGAELALQVSLPEKRNLVTAAATRSEAVRQVR